MTAKVNSDDNDTLLQEWNFCSLSSPMCYILHPSSTIRSIRKSECTMKLQKSGNVSMTMHILSICGISKTSVLVLYFVKTTTAREDIFERSVGLPSKLQLQ